MARVQNGRHNSKARLDSRGRVSLPRSIRKHLGVEKGGSVVILRGFNEKKCLTILREDKWKEKEARFSASIEGFDELNMDVLRVLIGDIDYQDIDEMGRILLSGNFIEYAGLKKDVIFIKLPDMVEIWDADTWAQEEERIRQLIKEKGLKISDLLGGRNGESNTQAGNG